MVINTDLIMLFSAAILAALSFLPYFVAYLICWGVTGIVGNRVGLPLLPDWANRAIAAHRNLTENLVHFAAFVVIAQFIGAANATTALGAQIFFSARAAYMVIYIAGFPWVRTLAFVAGWIGEMMIVIEIFKKIGAG